AAADARGPGRPGPAGPPGHPSPTMTLNDPTVPRRTTDADRRADPVPPQRAAQGLPGRGRPRQRALPGPAPRLPVPLLQHGSVQALRPGSRGPREEVRHRPEPAARARAPLLAPRAPGTGFRRPSGYNSCG